MAKITIMKKQRVKMLIMNLKIRNFFPIAIRKRILKEGKTIKMILVIFSMRNIDKVLAIVINFTIKILFTVISKINIKLNITKKIKKNVQNIVIIK